MTGTQGNAFTFTLNGETVEIRDTPPNTTLLDWLRANSRLGSKCGCNEGDCGACTVSLLDADASGRPAWRAMNSCIALLPMFAGREIVTVEGVQPGSGCPPGELHPVQSCMVKHYGSQCGYCTPGFIMSMFEGYYRSDIREPWQIGDQLAGNLCRCTGYRPIREAAGEAFAQAPAEADPFARRLAGDPPVSAPLAYETRGERFLRPTSLADLLALQREFPAARLIAGATEIGVEINKRYLHFPQLISVEGVPELREIRATPTAWHLGAAATLTAIEESLAGEFPSIAKMLWVFGFRQLRNRATLGGSLATASPIGDAAPPLLSLDAEIVLASPVGERTLPLAEFFTGYRQTGLRPGEVIRSVFLPRPPPGRRAEFYKVSKRREMDISAVSGAFVVETDAAGVVVFARLAFGGVAATPCRAPRAEAAAIGQPLEASLGAVSQALAEEFSPLSDHRGSAGYRRQVIAGLWEKFVRGESGPQDQPVNFLTRADWAAADTASRALAHESAAGHVTGRAEYTDDIARRRPMLEMWPVTSPHAHAKITRRDVAAARRAPGVRAVLLAEDVPGHNNVGVSRKDEILLADEEVFYHGHLVAIVLGDTLAACQAAAKLVEVDYEPLPAVVTLRDALAQNSFHTEPNYMRRGDWRAALAAAPHALEGEFELGGQEHFYLETHAAWAEVDGDGNIHLNSSTQHPSEIQTMVSEVLHLPRHRIVVQAPRMGGGFGGKETQGNTWAALAALGALKTGRPVRVQLDRDLDMQLTGKRHPFHAKFQVGFAADGALLALRCELTSNGGWSLDLSLPVTDRAMFHVDNAYYLPHVEVSGRVARTNLTSQTAFRGFGGPQGMLVIEEIMDRIARRTGLRPEQVRERNLYHGSGETNTTHYGQEIEDNRIQSIWRELKETSDFAARREEIDRHNASHAKIKRGLAITPVKFGISFTYTPYNQAGAVVLIYRDGTVQINHAGTEMGQGLHTKILGVAMRELGLPAASIRIMTTATDKVPNTSATAASSGADLNGAAVRDACRQLRERLLPFAAKMLLERYERREPAEALRIESGAVFHPAYPDEALDFMEVVDRVYMERTSLLATGYYATPNIHWDRAAGKGRPFAYYACGAAVSEVVVDGYTGMSAVTRVDILHDVGESLNPGVDRGQIEGGFVQGMGWLTGEDLKWTDAGKLMSHSASTYAIPAISDAPPDFRVRFYHHAANPGTIHNSKAVGEPPLMLAISVREAIRDAVAGLAANGAMAGEVRLASPATGEAVLNAMTPGL